MRMTTGRLIALRLYMISLGRHPAFSRLLRSVLVSWLIRRPRGNSQSSPGKSPYVASSRFFDIGDLAGESPISPA